MNCSICGFDERVVKLTTMKADTGQKKSDQFSTVTVCTYCKEVALKENHPDHKENQAPPVDQGGYIKPSTPDTPPPVRPQ